MSVYDVEARPAPSPVDVSSSAVASAAMTYVEPGMSMIFGHGRATLELASALPDEPYHVLTPSIEIIRHLSLRQHIRLTLPGGTLFHDRGVIVSPYNDPILHHFVASRAFIAAEGLSADGVLLSDPVIVHATRHLLEQATDIVILADSRTFSQTATLSVCPLLRISTLIIDTGVRPEALRALKAANVAIHLVT